MKQVKDITVPYDSGAAKEKELRAVKTIYTLAGGIAHDFNNILATISGYSELLQNDLPDNSPAAQNVYRIQMAVRKARSLTNQLLTFSRQMEQEKVPVNICEVLKETVGFVKSSAPPEIIIRSLIRRKNTTVLADPTLLFRVFLNLMTNAVQSIEERKGIITVSLSLLDGKIVQNELGRDIIADEYVLVTIRDTGKGMDPSLLKRVFEPFFTTREVGKGTGLGLSVVHGIVSEVGGEVRVSSEKGKGSVFYVYLPVHSEPGKPSVRSEIKRRILFIEGNKHESRIMSLALRSAGYEIIRSSDPDNLWKLMEDAVRRPDLIIYMGDAEQIGTEDLLNIYRNHEITTPCILISDVNQNILEEKLVNSGIIRQHLIKPVSLKEIKSAIQMSI